MSKAQSSLWSPQGWSSHTGHSFPLVNDCFYPSHRRWLQAYMDEGEIIVSLRSTDV